MAPGKPRVCIVLLIVAGYLRGMEQPHHISVTQYFRVAQLGNNIQSAILFNQQA
jgi:hypothetical protein